MIRFPKNENEHAQAGTTGMKRMLIIGNEHEKTDSVEWMNVKKVNVTDYQVVILDLTTYPAGYPHFSTVRNSVLSLLRNRHSVIYILPHIDLLMSRGIIFPLDINIKAKKGITTTCNIKDPIMKFYNKYVKEHEIIILGAGKAYTYGKNTLSMKPLIVNNISEYCSLKYDYLYLLHPPQKKDHIRAIDSLVNYFSPDLDDDEYTKPEWALQYEQEKLCLEKIDSEISAIKEKIEHLAETRENLIIQRSKIAKWTDLITRQGNTLEVRLVEAFQLLGVEDVKHEPNGSHGADITLAHNGLEFTIEVEGSKKAIKIDKARQLLHWIVDAPSNHKGILLGNPFREDDIVSRPPNKQTLFVKETVQLADKYNLALLPTSEIFELVCLKVADKEVNIEEVLKKLYDNSGLVSLS